MRLPAAVAGPFGGEYASPITTAGESAEIRHPAEARRPEAELRGVLHEIEDCAARALADARTKLAEGRSAVEAEVERLEKLRTATETLLAARPQGEST